jgi:rhodanese-related sulfurtransferase
MKKASLIILSMVILVISSMSAFLLAEDVPMITKERLNAILDDPDLVIFDVRLGSDYFSSDSKIKGAIRPDRSALILHTAGTYPKDTTFVVYCSSANQEQSLLNAKLLIKGYKDLGHEPREKVYVLKGGWQEWLRADLPTQEK